MLFQILGTGITNRLWETIVRHASTCVVDDNQMYTYYQAWNKAGILFNSVMKVAQATLDGKTYQSLHQLTPLRRYIYHNFTIKLPSVNLSEAIQGAVFIGLVHLLGKNYTTTTSLKVHKHLFGCD